MLSPGRQLEGGPENHDSHDDQPRQPSVPGWYAHGAAARAPRLRPADRVGRVGRQTPTAVQIVPHGFTHGSRRWPGRRERPMWNWCLVLFAGSYAEAFETRRSLARTLRTSGKLDLEAAAPAVAWLVRRGYARTRMEALRRVHAETLVFLMLQWDAIERVAAGLLKGRQADCAQGPSAGADLIAVARQRHSPRDFRSIGSAPISPTRRELLSRF